MRVCYHTLECPTCVCDVALKRYHIIRYKILLHDFGSSFVYIKLKFDNVLDLRFEISSFLYSIAIIVLMMMRHRFFTFWQVISWEDESKNKKPVKAIHQRFKNMPH